MPSLRVALAQLPNRVGDLDGNVERIGAAMAWAEEEAGADVLVVPELALTGYGLGDLVLHDAFVEDAREALDTLAERSGAMTTVISTIDRVPPRRSWDSRDRSVAIGAALVSGGQVRGMYHKIFLPLYDLFLEARNFAPGDDPGRVWRIGETVAGVAICEDLWGSDGPPEAQAAAGAQILFAPNASPYHRGKAEGRLANTREVALRNGLPVVYVNFSGAQDDLVFDGGSIVVDAGGRLLARAKEFAEDRLVVDVPVAPPRPSATVKPPRTVHTRPLLREEGPPPPEPPLPLDDVATVWHALVAALRYWTERNRIDGVALGLSGGVDSAITAMLAVDALGVECVLGVSLPDPDTPADELADARALAATLGIELVEEELEADTDTTDAWRHDRRMARRRAAALLELADARNMHVLATGNKTEISLGETTRFGDLLGHYAPLRDCTKTMLYELAEWRDPDGRILPPRTLSRPSTTHRLTPLDQFSYETLDDVVQRYVEHGQDLDAMVAAGHDAAAAEEIVRRIDASEVVRRYTPPGPKVTSRAFGHDRQMPIFSDWQPHPHGGPTPPVAPGPELPEMLILDGVEQP
jgi:NAD+ synthase (glutamine-hydrolysing)